jgi:hypothetical protein
MINDNTGRMATELPVRNGAGNGAGTNGSNDSKNFTVKTGLARMLQGGVIMDVVNAEQVCFTHICTQLDVSSNESIGTNRRRGRCSGRYGSRTCASRHQGPGRRS